LEQSLDASKIKKTQTMKKSLFYYTAILFLALSSCHKETKPTVVNGTVVDKKTGAGIDHAVVTFSIYHQNNEPDHLTNLWRSQRMLMVSLVMKTARQRSSLI
jgi:hypothetical protein